MRRQVARRRWWLAHSLILAVFAGWAHADVHRVPDDYPSIQAALNALANDDTVLVSLGTYAEELLAPRLRFWLIGNVETDTGDFERPTIDPSSLDSARWRKCMFIPDGSEPVVERMGFVNRSPMYPRPDAWTIGGVEVNSAENVTFRYCRFDSVFRALVDQPPEPPPTRLRVEDCRFLNAPRIQVRSTFGRVEVRRCYFEGRHCSSELVGGGDGSVIEECVFTGDSVYSVVALFGLQTQLRNCVFGPIDSCVSAIFTVFGWNEGVVEGNLFHDIGCGDWLSGWLHRVGEEPLVFRHNWINHLATYRPNSSTGILVYRYQPGGGSDAVIDSNTFDFLDSAPTAGFYRGIALSLEDPVSATGNYFANLMPDTLPDVATLFGSSGSRFRFNRFSVPGYGMGGPEVSPVDAILNYWGDPTGPYNATYNPQGLGARVDDAVLFDPWCPDTNCFDSAPDPSGFVHPSSFILSCYPNPFNSTLHLTLIPAQVGIVKVQLFDILGRRAAEIWHGPLAYQKDITFNASALASGIYFARVTDVISRKHLATAKLVLLK